jgi:outer membrane protein OmpA-like peptidoglycan-associated protein
VTVFEGQQILVGMPRRISSCLNSLAAFACVVASTFAFVPSAHASTATTTTLSASPSPAVAGQSVTLTATTSAPGTVTFTYDGQTIGTASTVGSGVSLAGMQRWTYTGNSSPWRLAGDSSGNLYVSTYNPSDCGGGRCQTKQLTAGGGVSYAPSESWNGLYVSVVGLAVDSSGAIYEAVFNGTAQNTIRKRTSIGTNSTTFVSAAALGVPSAGQGQISGMTIDANQNLYVTMPYLGEIKKITPAGVVSTYATGLGSPISGPVINTTSGVLYYINADKDVMQIPAGGDTPVLLAAASCNLETWNGSPWYGLGAQLAIDSAGFVYGAQCGGVTALSTPNNEPISQINPSTGAMRQYLGWDKCAQDPPLSDGWAAGCGGGQALAFVGDRMYTAGAHMGSAGVYGMSASGYVATLTFTPSAPGSFSTGATLTPTDSGTHSGSSGSGTLVVRPAAPSAPDLAAASDLGTSSTDDTTSDNTPRLEVPGTYATGDTITVTATKSGSSNVTCTYLIPATGCDLGTLADGTWSITATHAHPTGGTSATSTALSIAIDTTAPAAPTAVDLASGSNTGTSSTDNVTSDSTPTLGASGGSAGDTMTLTATKGSTSVSCTYVVGSATNCTLGTLEDGTWSISATLTDAAGNSSVASSALSMAIDTTGPSGSMPDLVAASDSGSSSSDDITADNTPTFTIPGQSTGDVITVTASKLGSPDATCTYTVGAATNCTLPALGDGSWNVSAAVTDLAGNTGNTLSLALAIDTTASAAPNVPDLLPTSDTGSSSTDDVTNDATPAISGLGASDADLVTVTATKAGGGTVSCTYVKSASVNSCDLPAMSDGEWAITTTNTDPAGNVSPQSAPLNMVLDTTAPSAPLAPDLLLASDTGVSGSDDLTGDNTPSMTGGAVPDGSTVTVSGRKADGSTVSCSYVASPSVTSCDLPAMSDGAWSMSATVADPAGNFSPAGPGLDIEIDTAAPIASMGPDLLASSDSGSSNSDNVTNVTTPELSLPSAMPGETVTLTATSPAGATANCSYMVTATVTSCTLGVLADGAWKISGTIADTSGNVSSASPALDITIDSTPPVPSAPDLLPESDNGSSDTDNLTNDTSPAFGLPGAIDGDSISIVAKKEDGTTVTCTFTKSAAISSCDLVTLTDGKWTVTASVTDAAGNTSLGGPAITLDIDTTPPTAPASPNLPTNKKGLTGNPTPTLEVDGVRSGEKITGSATNGKKSVKCVFVGAPGIRSCTLPMLEPGQWFISATATDRAGNVSEESGRVRIEVIDVGLPENTVSLKTVVTSVSRGSAKLTATLRHSELGKVANVVFVVRNPDGTVDRIVRVAAPTRQAAVSMTMKGMRRGQQVEAYTENWLGVSTNAPWGSNVVRAATTNIVSASGKPTLAGGKLVVSRIIFDPASPLLDDADKAQLDRIVWSLANKGGLVLISGFARQNKVDTKRFLDNLSVERAKAVANYLSGRGVRAWIRYEGYGAVTRGIGTWEDRKVEIRWVSGATTLPNE